MIQDKFAISPSQIKVLDSCELRWAFEHVKGLKERYKAHDIVLRSGKSEIKPVFSFNAFGRVAHQMFERFYKLNYKSPESFANAWDAAWKQYKRFNPIIFNLRSEKSSIYVYDGLGRAMAKKFHEENIDKRKESWAFEKEFILDVVTENFMIGLRGRIDRIGNEDGRTIISDYKTGSYRPSQDELRSGPQFPCYSFAYEKMEGEKPRIRVIYPGHGDNDTHIEHLEFSDEDHKRFYDSLDVVGQKRKSVVERAYNGDKLNANYGSHCTYCMFSVSGECDAYNQAGKFSYKKTAISVPSSVKPQRKKVPEGQTRMHWPRKDVILISEISNSQIKAEEDKNPYNMELF